MRVAVKKELTVHVGQMRYAEPVVERSYEKHLTAIAVYILFDVEVGGLVDVFQRSWDGIALVGC